MTLAAQIETDISAVFLSTDDFAVSITYTRGAASVTVPAVVSQTQYEQQDGQVLTRRAYRDYLVEASALVLNGSAVTPQRYDTITEGSKTYKVTSPDGEDVYGFDDENELLLRIHAILVDT